MKFDWRRVDVRCDFRKAHDAGLLEKVSEERDDYSFDMRRTYRNSKTGKDHICVGGYDRLALENPTHELRLKTDLGNYAIWDDELQYRGFLPGWKDGRKYLGSLEEDFGGSKDKAKARIEEHYTYHKKFHEGLIKEFNKINKSVKFKNDSATYKTVVGEFTMTAYRSKISLAFYPTGGWGHESYMGYSCPSSAPMYHKEFKTETMAMAYILERHIEGMLGEYGDNHTDKQRFPWFAKHYKGW